MYRLVRIEGFNDFRFGSKLKFVLYNGSEYKSYNAHVSSNFIDIEGYTNSQIFKDLGIENPMEYCKKYSKVTQGDFPVHKSIEDLRTTVNSFFKLNIHIVIPSLYKVGDKVRIKSTYDKNSTEDDYPCAFTKGMLENHGGKIYTIRSIHENVQGYRKHYLEPYYYKFKENTYNWSAAMFESKQNDSDLVVSSELKIVSITQSDPEIISDKPEVKQTKTQGNAYKFCKMRGTVRVGDVPEGNRICGKRSKASISSRPLGYREVTGY